MTDLDSLLTCLHQTPGDDVLWLAVADRLEEDGQAERAELLRLSRRLRGMEQASGTASACRVTAGRATAESRIRELIAAGVRPCVPEIVNSIGMRFALIPAGTFWMGSPEDEADRSEDETLHHVTLTRALWLGVHPVTQGQYEAVTGTNPSHFSKKGGGKAKVKKLDPSSFPVELVSWEDATAFCEALGKKDGLGHAYRLPSEAEWEYSCRGGLASGAFHFGDTHNKTQANFHDSGLQRTCRVGSYPPNAFGLHDMYGNVWEWCQDWYGDYPAGAVTDPTGPEEGSNRVIRSGSWCNVSLLCRSARRGGNGSDGPGLLPRLPGRPSSARVRPGAEAGGSGAERGTSGAQRPEPERRAGYRGSAPVENRQFRQPSQSLQPRQTSSPEAWMPFKFFVVPINDDGRAEAALNGFLRSHRVITVDRRWVDLGASRVAAPSGG